MLQKETINFKCKLHIDENIEFCCLKRDCKEERLVCFQCLKTTEHLQHMIEVGKLEQAQLTINGELRKLKEAITTSKNIFNEVQNLFKNLIKGLEDRVFGIEATINLMGQSEFQDTLSSALTFERVQFSIQQSIEPQISKLKKTIEEVYQNCQLNIFTKKDEQTLVEIGNYLIKQQVYQDAIKYYDECLNMNSQNEEALFGKAECLRVTQKFNLAIEFYQKVQSINQSNPQVYIQQGLEQLIFQESAYDIYINSRVQLFVTIKLQKQNKTDFKSIYLKGYCLQAISNFKQARECFNQIIQAGSDEIYTLLAKSMLLTQQLELDKATQILDEILVNSPFNYNALCVKIECLISLENYQEALITCETMIQRYPKDIRVFFYKGALLTQLQDFAEANKLVEELKEIDETLWMIQFFKALFLLQEDKIDQSLELFDSIMAINPQNVSVLKQKVLALILNQNDPEQTTKFYDELYSKQQFDQLPLILKGECLFLSKKFEEAISTFNIILSQDPDFCQMQILKVQCLMELKKYQEVMDFCDKMLDVYEENEIFKEIKNQALEKIENGDEQVEKEEVEQQEIEDNFDIITEVQIN
ncbi:unnamed protein product (macronuclear) [Paramecium tetraurelia]|uniref:Uncharacterized protein n=1 Tax=Paramecium tetraurelia TaxID=5888 RepID=A0E235_PARTE|nr:uncharacterized protein GSPATT00022523001 [Paramecium tetraurelia]CAK89352.1 unnamed protein product [Paramecium tetraurelia]|eukprot:XP_001456749.1 hypothetical protein (macronuclear) [Paramecium tetraurelia strain d4-2]